MQVLHTDHASGIWLPDCSTINQENYNDTTISWYNIIVKFVWRCRVSFVNFSYWSKFHVNIIVGSGVRTIFYKGLTRNLEIRNTPVWFLPINWRLGKVRDTKFGTNVCDKMLSNAPKCQGYSSYRFWVIKAKPIVPTSPIIPRPRLGLNFEKWVGGVWTF